MRRLFDDPAKLEECRRLRAEGMKLRELAERYGCSIATVHGVCQGVRGRQWWGCKRPAVRVLERKLSPLGRALRRRENKKASEYRKSISFGGKHVDR